MPRRDIQLCSGEFYHLYNRGNNREPIFFERENYLFFLRQLRQYLLPVLDVTAYCLMPTHYHLLVQIKANRTSKVLGEGQGMQSSSVRTTLEVSRAMEVFCRKTTG